MQELSALSRVAAAGLKVADDRESGELDGEVCLDRVVEGVVDRPGGEVAPGHPEGLLDMPQVVDGGGDRVIQVGWRSTPARGRQLGGAVPR